MSTLKDAYGIYKELGFILNPTQHLKKFSSKAGRYTERENSPYAPQATGFAAIIPAGLIIVDNDSYEDDNNFEDFVSDLGYIPTPFATTPSGGEHYAFTNPHLSMVVGDTSQYQKVDIFGGFQSIIPIVGTRIINKQNVEADYEWYDPKKQFHVNPWDEKLYTMLDMKPRGVKKGRTAPKHTLIDTEAFERNTELPDEMVDAILKDMPKDLAYPDWFDVGQCLFDRYNGSDEGLAKWEKFTRASSKANPNKSTAVDKWQSGHINPNSITWKSLVFLADTHQTTSYQKMMKHAKTEGEFESIQDKILNHRWYTGEINVMTNCTNPLAETWRQEHKRAGITARMQSLKNAVEDLDGIAQRVAEYHETREVPWINNIILDETITGARKYYDLRLKTHYTADGLTNIYFDELIKYRQERFKGKGSFNFANVTTGKLVSCGHSYYNPLCEDVVFQDEDGNNVLNLYKGRPKPADEFTEHGKELIQAFTNHVRMLMDAEEAEIFLNLIGWMVQNFGKKLSWAPLIQSVQGAGKSIIGDILINHIFGTANSSIVDPIMLLSENNTWAVEGMLKVLEEVRVAGHNRHEVMNRLKPVVTNNVISHIEKYKISQNVPNHTNIIAFTNYKDAIPADAGDRRWWIIYSRLVDKEQITTQTGLTLREYFTPLYELKDDTEEGYGAELLKYFNELDISAFEPNFLPESKHKMSAIASEDVNTEYMAELKDALYEDYQGVSIEVVSSQQLKDLLVNQYHISDNTLTARALGLLLKKMNYSKLPKMVRLKGIKHSLWTSLSMDDTTTVVKKFKESMQHGRSTTSMPAITDENKEGEELDEFDY